jgi:hypothetical protein
MATKKLTISYYIAHRDGWCNFHQTFQTQIEDFSHSKENYGFVESILTVARCPHPLTLSPKKGEGELDSKSLSQNGRGI